MLDCVQYLICILIKGGSYEPNELPLDPPLVLINGIYFALRSGCEHHQLRSDPCQIQVAENQGQRSYLVYTEDISKNRPGGLKGRILQPKVVHHHDSPENPERCFVRLNKYRRK